MQISEAQQIVKSWSNGNGWKDVPNIDKFDHIHEELVEMSQHLRYKSEAERIDYVKNNKNYFIAEMGDLLFGICRLANQLGVDLEEGFALTKDKAEQKYKSGIKESNIPWKNV
ncbi:MAG: MazG nucleotide pyrophosphohydrolase domain-containing protein [Patescibacteria group bacterium]|nr:MazG nucleotide pyrophosphohydrolase domain-containing protein [Patescibacteria group bacterium]